MHITPITSRLKYTSLLCTLHLKLWKIDLKKIETSKFMPLNYFYHRILCSNTGFQGIYCTFFHLPSFECHIDLNIPCNTFNRYGAWILTMKYYIQSFKTHYKKDFRLPFLLFTTTVQWYRQFLNMTTTLFAMEKESNKV